MFFVCMKCFDYIILNIGVGVYTLQIAHELMQIDDHNLARLGTRSEGSVKARKER